MKRISIYIASIIVFTFGSCSEDTESDRISLHNSIMSIEVIYSGAEEADYVKSVRFIVFDNASSAPILDINEVIIPTQEQQEATIFKATLKVNPNADKMVVAVINEAPTFATILNKITSPQALEDFVFSMTDVFNSNHTIALSSGIPMSGVKRGISITADNDTEAEAAQVTMTVERTVARVDIFLKKDDDPDLGEVWLENTDTEFILSRSHDKGYLVTGTIDDKTRYQTGSDARWNFGHMQDVTSPAVSSNWIYQESQPTILDENYQFICSFYTPERLCNTASNKLKIELNGIHTTVRIKNVETILDKIYGDDGIEHSMDTVKRNNVYQVWGRVKDDKIIFECKISNWEDVPQTIIIDPQFMFKITTDDISLSGTGHTKKIKAQTDYNRTDLGYPRGLQLKGIAGYYGSDDTVLSSADGDSYGWLILSASGSDGDLEREITFQANNALTTNNTGCYAVVEISAGNITKKIKITRTNI